VSIAIILYRYFVKCG